MTFPIKLPVAILMEHEDRVELGNLVELGPDHACVRTNGRWSSGDTVVITVSVPEAAHDKTQAMLRLRALVRRRTPAGDTEGAYVLDFESAGPNLVSATELLGRFRTRGLLDQ
ncbi:MAG TPA: hypothetical protein VIG29_21020 [Vicinamibacteria bacterium]|jgi:hypothetical protein